MKRVDVVVVGAGPAGLAAAMEATTRGYSVVVLEKQAGPPDKACGEGLLPPGRRYLERWGIDALLPADGFAPLRGIRYVQEDGTSVEAALPRPGGWGVRRTVLAQALATRAGQLGVEIRWQCPWQQITRTPTGIHLSTSQGDVHASLLVAADGLHSPIRKQERMETPTSAGKRYGLRQHFALQPWSNLVEVHWAHDVEAYITPAGPKRVGVAFLWQHSAGLGPASMGEFLKKFPVLQSRLGAAPADSAPRGAGPLFHKVVSRVRDRLVLLGDAAGYVDAITGEGLSLAFAGAEALGRALPLALRNEATAGSLQPYVDSMRKAYLHYATTASLVLFLARHPSLRQRLLHRLAAHPHWLECMLQLALVP